MKENKYYNFYSQTLSNFSFEKSLGQIIDVTVIEMKY